MQAEVNIGLLGHVDHGKTSVTHALSSVWTDKYSEEVKRGISIRIGYADVDIYKCNSCNKYTTEKKCPECKGKTKLLRKISLLDAPGHETLMATAISASSIMDGAVLVIAANEKCPQPQTKEHLMVLQAMGIKKIIIVQNKIDLVTKEEAEKNHKNIEKFLAKFGYKNLPIIPMAANFKINVDILLEAMQEFIPTPKRDDKLPFKMYITRSFDVNKPSSSLDHVLGGVVGGSIIQGKLKKGEKIEIKPGIPDKKDSEPTPIITTAESIFAGPNSLKTGKPGGLIGIATYIDPSWTKGDRLIGSLIGKPGSLPELTDELSISYNLFERTDYENPLFKKGEPIVISVGTATTVGIFLQPSKDELKLKLKRAICKDTETSVAISRRIGQRWRLSGYGKILD